MLDYNHTIIKTYTGHGDFSLSYVCPSVNMFYYFKRILDMGGEENMRSKNLISYNQSDLIREIAADYAGQLDRDDIRNVLESYEYHIREHLCEAAELEKPIVVKLFSGLQINSRFVPEHITNTPFGNNVEVSDRIRVTARTSRHFTRRLNEEAFNN